LNWITVSPKKSPLPIKQLVASEVKYVLAAGDPLPLSPVLTDRHFISPAFCGSNLDPAAVEWCIKVIHDNPTWRLSLQTHKWINVR